MISRRYAVVALVVLAGLGGSLPARAFDARAFDEAGFAAAQASGKPILLDVTAPWCPTCKAQKPILSELGGRAKFKNVVAYTIDFDSRKDLLRRFNVHMQSTLITFSGTKEVARSTGDTNAASIEAQLDKAV